MTSTVDRPLRIVILGLSVTSSWGNGHATNFRALMRAMEALGHDVLFLERDTPWYAAHRDLPHPPWGRTELYADLDALRSRFRADVVTADLVLLGSYVPNGIAVGDWVTRTAEGVCAFYDIDTPITLAALEAGECEYMSAELIPRFDLYLSFTGGPTLAHLEERYGVHRAVAFHCLVDELAYTPLDTERRWELGYLGTYSADRQPTLDRLLLEPARRLPDAEFVVGGPQYPGSIAWPSNVEVVDHVAPAGHRAFYCGQRFTLNVTRTDMVNAGWSPSVRLFEAAACGVPVISDPWDGLDHFFEPGREILIARSADDVVQHLREIDERARIAIGRAARQRVLDEHTAAHRVAELHGLVRTVLDGAPA